MLGNDDVNSQVSRTYFVAGKMFNSISGKTLGNIGNTKLQWETTNRLTAGIQLAAAKNRIQFGINYFRSTTRNLLSLNALSYLTGMNTNWTNGGKSTCSMQRSRSRVCATRSMSTSMRAIHAVPTP